MKVAQKPVSYCPVPNTRLHAQYPKYAINPNHAFQTQTPPFARNINPRRAPRRDSEPNLSQNTVRKRNLKVNHERELTLTNVILEKRKENRWQQEPQPTR